jgi:hypothetical protein
MALVYTLAYESDMSAINMLSNNNGKKKVNMKKMIKLIHDVPMKSPTSPNINAHPDLN